MRWLLYGVLFAMLLTGCNAGTNLKALFGGKDAKACKAATDTLDVANEVQTLDYSGLSNQQVTAVLNKVKAFFTENKGALETGRALACG